MDETLVKIKAPVYAVRAAGSVFVFIKVPFSLVPSVFFLFLFFVWAPAGRNDGKTFSVIYRTYANDCQEKARRGVLGCSISRF